MLPRVLLPRLLRRPLELSFHDQRIHDVSTVMYHDIAQDIDFARTGIDFDFDRLALFRGWPATTYTIEHGVGQPVSSSLISLLLASHVWYNKEVAERLAST